MHTAAFCACPWLTVLRLLILSGPFTTCNQVGFLGKKKKTNLKQVCTEWEIKQILERYRACHIPNPKGLLLSVLIADHLPLPDYSCSLPVFQTTSSYLPASSCTETLPNYLYTDPEACSFYKACKTIALPCTFTRNQLLINSQKAKILHLHACICTWIRVKYIYT